MNWYLEVLKKYAEFNGRARRQEYWMFVLINVIVSVGLYFISRTLGMMMGERGVLDSLYALVVFVPSLAVTVRRLHDTGKSGLWVLINLVPCVGWIISLVFLVQEGEAGPNQYGPNPKVAAW